MKKDYECLSHCKPKTIDLAKWQQTVDLLLELFDASSCAVVQLRQGEFNVVTTSPKSGGLLRQSQSWPRESESFCRQVIENRSLLYVDHAQQDEFWRQASLAVKANSYCGVPLYWPDGSPFGTLCVFDDKLTHYSATLQKVLGQLAALIMADLKIYQDHQALQELALVDEMTEVYNRRGLTILGEQKLKDAKRYQSSVGVIYLDIDNLKLVNEKFGYQVGDSCIKTLAEVLSHNFRESDVIARVGGDEFIVISQIGSRLELTALAHRVDQKYSNEVQGNIQLEETAVTFGTSIIDCYSNLPFEELLERADRNMHQHKQSKKAV